MSEPILTITLNPAIDKSVEVPDFRKGRTFRERGISLSAGGKGINVSRVLNKLGIPTLATGFLGGRDGVFLRDELTGENIPHDFLTIQGNTRTSLNIVDPYETKITRLLERGPDVSDEEKQAFLDKVSGLIQNASFVVMSGRNIPMVGDDFYARLMDITTAQNKRTIVDTSGAALRVALKRKPFMIKPNLKETEQYFNRPLKSLGQIKEAVKEFAAMGITLICISMGAKGALAYDGRRMLLAEPPKVKATSTVGCGDSMIAGFLASYLHKGEDFEAAVRMAVATGTANVMGINPGHLEPKNVYDLYPQVSVRPLKY